MVAVYTDCDHHLQQILNCLDQNGYRAFACMGIDVLRARHAEQPVAVAVAALSGGAEASQEQYAHTLQFLEDVCEADRLIQTILLTDYPLSLEQSCQAVIAGVAAIIDGRRKDSQDRLLNQVQSVLQYRLEEVERREREQLLRACEEHGLVGASLAIQRVLEQAARAADVSDAPVIVFGESGTGKQRIAEIVHRLDRKRSPHPFVCVNCAAISGTLAESELFGHRKGAFTGATEDRQGYFRAAHQGTILLDEISELSQNLQPKILRVLQEGLVMPVGSDTEHHVDVRVVAASNRNLRQMVDEGQFRLDLFQRLNVIHLTIPPLRQRVDDIPPLFEAFLAKYAHYCPCEITEVDQRVYEVLAQTIGSGNVRELENLVRQVLVFKKRGHRIELADLPQEMILAHLRKGTRDYEINIPDEIVESLVTGKKKLADALDDFERAMLTRLVQQGYSQTDLADRIGVTRRTLYNKLQRHRLR